MKSNELKNKTSKLNLGDSLHFGKFAIDGKNVEPLEWVIIKQDKNTSILVSRKIVSVLQGVESKVEKFVKWPESNVRDWLNNTFYNSAFNNEEKNNIVPTTLISKISDDFVDNVSLLDFNLYFKYCYGILDYDLNDCFLTKLKSNNNYSFLKVFDVFILDTDGKRYKDKRIKYNSFDFCISNYFSNDYSCVRPIITVKNSYLESINAVEFDADIAVNEVINTNHDKEKMMGILDKKFPNSYSKNYCIAKILSDDYFNKHLESICSFHENDFEYKEFNPVNYLLESAFKKVFKTILQCARKNLKLSVEKDNDDPNLNIGDMISFGKYSNYNLEDSPILWEVINIEKDQALLLSKKVMCSEDETHYSKNNDNWGLSKYRKYLNNKFYNTCFTDKEKERMISFAPNINLSNSGKKINDLFDYVSIPDINIINSSKSKSALKHYRGFREDYNNGYYLYMNNSGDIMYIDEHGKEKNKPGNFCDYRPVILIKLKKK